MRNKVWGIDRGKNPSYTRRTWRLDAGVVEECEDLWVVGWRRVVELVANNQPIGINRC
jgi:hypothetical protein